MPPAVDLLQGTLDLLVLRTLQPGPQHGWGIAQRIQQISEDVLRVDQGSLYPVAAPARARGLDRGGVGQLGQQPQRQVLPADARGPKRLADETASWERLSAAVARVLRLA